jgi:hypothetical protein
MAGSAGPTGYADYQRTENWDSPLIREAVKLEHVGSQAFGRFNCARYAFLVGRMGVENQGIKLILRWWSAEEGGVIIGERSWLLTQIINNVLQLRIPNMGPWLEIEYESEGGVWHETAILGFSNRVFPTEVIPPTEFILSAEHKFVGAGETFEFTPENYFSGPVRVGIEQPAEAEDVIKLIVSNTLGTTRAIEQLNLKKKVDAGTMYMPLGWAKFSMVGGVAQLVKITVTPILTGSS